MASARLSVRTSSAAETRRLGAKLAPLLEAGDIVLFQAQLGAGKTTFVQGIARALGAKDAALSPTFVVAETIEAKTRIHHLDFYRLTLPEILGMGVEDYLNGAGAVGPGIALIEWAERFRRMWPAERLEIRVRVPARKNTRVFEFSGRGERSLAIIDALRRKVA